MADTTKINMGRRQHPKCANLCNRRVDVPGDELCRVCRGHEKQVERPIPSTGRKP